MNTKDFLDKYGWWKPIYYNPAKCKKVWNGRYDKNGYKQEQTYVLCECSICHEEDWVRWQPNINEDMAFDREYAGSGYYVCHPCSLMWFRTKQIRTIGVEGCSAQRKKAIENAGPEKMKDIARRAWTPERQKAMMEGVSRVTPEQWHEAAKKGVATRESNGTNFMEYEIPRILAKFPGGYHAPCFTVHSDLPGEDWISMEMDIYYPFVNKCIELDTPDHRFKSEGYHRRKREYLQNHGIDVLNIAVNRHYTSDVVHPRTPGIGSMYDLIDRFLSGTLPKEYEIIWDDPWYVNG